MLLARTFSRTLAELGETMDSREFVLWAAEYAREPWGDLRIDLAGGIVAATIANVHRGKQGKVAAAIDFMPLSKEKSAEAAPPVAKPGRSEADQFLEYMSV